MRRRRFNKKSTRLIYQTQDEKEASQRNKSNEVTERRENCESNE
jgi:hypothetical protein